VSIYCSRVNVVMPTRVCFGQTLVSRSLRSVFYDLMDITKFILFITVSVAYGEERTLRGGRSGVRISGLVNSKTDKFAPAASLVSVHH